MTRFLLAALLLVAAPSGARDKIEPIDRAASYVLVEVDGLDAAMMKGVNMPGSLTIAPYDITSGDVAGGRMASRIIFFDKPFARSKAGRQYLVKVQPTTWVIEGASGTAFSLGSMTFEVKAGEVVDLGVVKPAVDWAEGEGPKSLAGGMIGAALFGSMKPKQIRPVRVDWRPRAAGDLPVPPALAGRALTPVSFRPGATFGNHLGGLVNRFGGRKDRPSE